MRTRVYITVLGLFLTAVAAFYLAGGKNNLLSPDKQLHVKCLDPIVFIAPVDKNSCGTGFIVRSELVDDTGKFQNVFITCAHVAESSDKPFRVKVFTYKNWATISEIREFPCVFYASNIKRDLAIGVFASDSQMPTVEIDFDPVLYIGTDVCRIGCGLGDEPRLDCGKISGIKLDLGENMSGLIRTTIHTTPGDSGSPMFFNYKVIGITQAIRWNRGMPIFGISYNIPISRLLEWDEEDDNAYQFAWTENEIPQLPFYKLNMEITRDRS